MSISIKRLVRLKCSTKESEHNSVKVPQVSLSKAVNDLRRMEKNSHHLGQQNPPRSPCLVPRPPSSLFHLGQSVSGHVARPFASIT